MSYIDPHYRLLETGSTQLIRNTAAQQLADVQKAHPEELFNLLTRVVPYLRHRTWDTRVAAAKALGGIVDNAEKYDPNSNEDSDGHNFSKIGEDVFAIKKEENGDISTPLPNDMHLTLETLNLPAILKYGKELARGTGREIDYALTGLDPAERLEHQKRTVVMRLGLRGKYVEEDVYSDADVAPTTKQNGTSTPRQEVPNGLRSRHDSSSSHSGPPGATTLNDEPALSARQLNQLKRKRKREAMQAGGKNRLVDLSVRRSNTMDPSTTPDALMTDVGDADDNSNGQVSEYFSLDRPADVDEESKVVSEFKGPVIPMKACNTTPRRAALL